MPAKSKSQQRFFGMLHAIQNGTLSKKKVSPEMRRKAKQIDPESVRHFAETKHKDLPERKEKEEKNAFDLGFKTKLAEYGIYGIDPKSIYGDLRLETQAPTPHLSYTDQPLPRLRRSRFNKKSILGGMLKNSIRNRLLFGPGGFGLSFVTSF